MSNYPHVEICKASLNDNNVYNNFKSFPEFRQVLEHASYELGLEYFEELIKNYSWIKLNWNLVLENDKIGNPVKYDYSKYKNITGVETISPSTLRYIYTGACILDLYKNRELDSTESNRSVLGLAQNLELNIVEIGGGYGGQCKILFDMATAFGVNIKKYTIIDLKYVSLLQEKYLQDLGYTAEYIAYENLIENTKLDIESNTLCISNYGLGELPVNIQDFYIDNIVKKCNWVYIIWCLPIINSYFNNDKFTITDENPQTSHEGKNKLITSFCLAETSNSELRSEFKTSI